MSEEGRAVRWEKSDHVATVWLCNPDKKNAMGPAFWKQLPQVMKAVSADPDVRAVALCAEGPAYSVGLDLKQMTGLLMGQGEGQSELRQRLLSEVSELQEAITSVADCPVPVVTALHGFCLGGGVDLSTACDIRLAAKDLTLSVREVRMAIVADVGTLQRLPRVISKGQASEMIFSGKDYDAAYCRDIGLVNHVYESREEVIQAALDLAREMAQYSPLALKGSKDVMRFSEDKTVADGLKYVAVWNSAFVFSEDLTEALTAFMEKRKPEFKGR